MRPDRLSITITLVLLAATASTAGEVVIRFSGTTDEGDDSRPFSGSLTYQTPLPAMEGPFTDPEGYEYRSYNADAWGAQTSFITWALKIDDDSYAPVAAVFLWDEIRVYDDSFGVGYGDLLSLSSHHTEGSVQDWNVLNLTFGDTTGTLLTGWGVPEPLPRTGWSSVGMILTTWENSTMMSITGTVDTVSVVPLPPAVWAGLGLLGVLGIPRRLRRS